MAGRKRKILLFVLDCQTRNSEGVFERKNNFRRGGGVYGNGIPKAWGGRAFWNFRRQGGVKFRCHPWYGTDIFWNRPMIYFGYFSFSTIHLELKRQNTFIRFRGSLENGSKTISFGVAHIYIQQRI